MSEREAKKAQFNEQPSRRGQWLALAAIAILALGALGWNLAAQGNRAAGTSGVATAPAGDGILRIPLSELADGKAHFYRQTIDGKELSIFLVKESDGTIRSAFDTCDACYAAKKGYRQEGAQMICNNCNQAFAINRIGTVSGGCNPVPLTVVHAGSMIEIRPADLGAGLRYF